MTATETLRALTVPAPKIEIGDVIDGRVVRSVNGRKPRSCQAIYSSAAQHGASGTNGRALPALTFSGHVVVVGFEDGGAMGHYYGSQSVAVQRGPNAPSPLAPMRTGISAIRAPGDEHPLKRRITGWRWVVILATGRTVRGEADSRQGAIDEAERAGRDE